LKRGIFFWDILIQVEMKPDLIFGNKKVKLISIIPKNKKTNLEIRDPIQCMRLTHQSKFEITFFNMHIK